MRQRARRAIRATFARQARACGCSRRALQARTPTHRTRMATQTAIDALSATSVLVGAVRPWRAGLARLPPSRGVRRAPRVQPVRGSRRRTRRTAWRACRARTARRELVRRCRAPRARTRTPTTWGVRLRARCARRATLASWARASRRRAVRGSTRAHRDRHSATRARRARSRAPRVRRRAARAALAASARWVRRWSCRPTARRARTAT